MSERFKKVDTTGVVEDIVGITRIKSKDDQTGNSAEGTSTKSDRKEAKAEAGRLADDKLRAKQGPFPSD